MSQRQERSRCLALTGWVVCTVCAGGPTDLFLRYVCGVFICLRKKWLGGEDWLVMIPWVALIDWVALIGWP